MTFQDLLDEMSATYNGDERQLSYTVIVTDEESNEFHGVKSVQFNHADRNVTIETL